MSPGSAAVLSAGVDKTGMSDGHRAFCMGNARVTGMPHEIGKALVKSLGE